MSNILIGSGTYWTEFFKAFGIDGSVAGAILCIKANGNVKLEVIMQDGEQRHVSGLATRPFLIDFLDKMDIPVGNHVLEICLELKHGNIATLTYTCAADTRLTDIDWKELEIFGEMR